MTFTEKYSKILDIVKPDIDKINLVEEIYIQEPLKSKLSNILGAPSKHIRALVSFLYLRAINSDIDEKQIKYQTAIELVHNASLIHDDVIDKSFERRGVKTLNFEFDSKLAVIAGDYLLSIAMQKVLDLNIPELSKLFCKTLEEMTKGEISQYYNKNRSPTIEKYITKSEQKTAKLFETALAGAMIISCHSDALSSNKTFAKNFGIAFQIRDDLINCKTTKSDIKEGIYTAPVIYSGGVNITDDAIEKTKSLLNNYLEQAQNVLKDIEDNKYRVALIELLGLLKYE